jgi:hypothetical protein
MRVRADAVRMKAHSPHGLALAPGMRDDERSFMERRMRPSAQNKVHCRDQLYLIEIHLGANYFARRLKASLAVQQYEFFQGLRVLGWHYL